METCTIEIKRGRENFLGTRDWIVTLKTKPEMEFMGADLKDLLVMVAKVIQEV